MANIKVIDVDRVSYRVRILRDGEHLTTVYIDDYETAVDWAYTELRLSVAISTTPMWAAVIEQGVRFEGFSDEKTLFAVNGQLREGLVLDKSLLGSVDRNHLFGLR